MIPYGRQDISQADIDAVVEVLRSDWLTQGPMVPRFEEAVAKTVGASFGVAVNSATSALHLACLALDVGPNDWVWTSPNTFVASANCALYCGANIDFVDIDERTYNISIAALQQKLCEAEKIGRLPKVVIPVHFAGQPCEMEAIFALSQKFGFKLIEDASHAIGAHRNQEKVGSCKWSDVTVFSFHPVKIITSGEGGMALTNDPTLARRMRQLRTHGITNAEEFMEPRPPNEIWNYQQIELGFNYRMTDIQAALGLSQLSRLGEFISRRHEVAARYYTALSNMPVVTPWQNPESYSSYHLYPIKIIGKDTRSKRVKIFRALQEMQVGVNLHYIPVHRHPFYEKMGFKEGDFPKAESYFQQAISLPIFPTLDESSQDYVVESTRNALRYSA